MLSHFFCRVQPRCCEKQGLYILTTLTVWLVNWKNAAKPYNGFSFYQMQCYSCVYQDIKTKSKFLIFPPVSDSKRSVCQTADADQWFIWRQGCCYTGTLQHSTQVSQPVSYVNINYSHLRSPFCPVGYYVSFQRQQTARFFEESDHNFRFFFILSYSAHSSKAQQLTQKNSENINSFLGLTNSKKHSYNFKIVM